MIVSVDERVREQLQVAGITAVIGAVNVYLGDERVGATLARAEDDAARWVAERAGGGADGAD